MLTVNKASEFLPAYIELNNKYNAGALPAAVTFHAWRALESLERFLHDYGIGSDDLAEWYFFNTYFDAARLGASDEVKNAVYDAIFDALDGLDD